MNDGEMVDTQALGLVEVRGLGNALLAADAALKTAGVIPEGIEATKGSGLMLLRLRGSVSEVQNALLAARAALSREGVAVFATHVIPRTAVPAALRVSGHIRG